MWNIYVVEGQPLQADFAAFQNAWPETPNPPAITVVFVSGLAHPDFLVGVDPVALVPQLAVSRTSENAVIAKLAQFTFQALERIAYDMPNPLERRETVSSLIKRLLREVFRHHSNPWSTWTRLLLSVPLVFLPIWKRSWREGAIVVVWLIVNPNSSSASPRTIKRGQRGRCSER